MRPHPRISRDAKLAGHIRSDNVADLRKRNHRPPRRRAFSLVTFFGQAKKVTFKNPNRGNNARHFTDNPKYYRRRVEKKLRV